MLLRTSSAPVLSALIYHVGEVSCRDPGGDSLTHQCNCHCSNLTSSHSLASPFHLPSRSPSETHGLLPLADEPRTPGVTSVWDLNTERTSRPQAGLGRVQSEGDLACFSATVMNTQEALPGTESIRGRSRRVPRVSSRSALDAMDLKEGSEEETERGYGFDQSPAHTAFSTGNTFSLHEDIHQGTREGFSNSKIPLQGLLLNDGEVYTSLQLSSCRSPLVCNGRGCRPLTEAETRALGFLDMASGIGFMDGSGYVGEHSTCQAFGPDITNRTEAYYQELIQADPENPLVLRNYAEFLSKKGELAKSEEYYARAILADPTDGEVLSQYAKLQWDVNRDQGCAETYYDQALKAAPDDCYVMASYASFLWDVEDNEECPATPAVVPGSGGVGSSHALTTSCVC